MKHTRKILACLMTTVMMLSTSGIGNVYAEDNTDVNLIQNEKLLEVLCNSNVDKDGNGKISKDEILQTTRLNLANDYIGDASELGQFVNLTWLRLSCNGLYDITSLKSLVNLEYLDLCYNYFSDVSALTSMKNLQELDLSGNRIVDITTLGSLTSLRTLDLSENKLTDTSALKSLTNLEDLSLGKNQLTDAGSWNTMTNLSNLDLSENRINKIGDSAFPGGLAKLDLSENEITDFSALSSLENLNELKLNGNKSEDISPLTSLTNIDTLYLSDLTCNDLSALQSMSNLHKLSLCDSRVEDISGVGTLTGLDTLYLTNMNLSKIDDLASLEKLTYLNLSDNYIEDISALSGLHNLRTLDLSKNSITDIQPLEDMTNLTLLHLNSNNLYDLDGFDFIQQVKASTSDAVSVKVIQSLPGVADINGSDIKDNSKYHGDINQDGCLSLEDAKLIRQYIKGEISGEGLQVEAADLNGDGVVTLDDTSKMKYLLEQIEGIYSTQLKGTPKYSAEMPELDAYLIHLEGNRYAYQFRSTKPGKDLLDCAIWWENSELITGIGSFNAWSGRNEMQYDSLTEGVGEYYVTLCNSEDECGYSRTLTFQEFGPGEIYLILNASIYKRDFSNVREQDKKLLEVRELEVSCPAVTVEEGKKESVQILSNFESICSGFEDEVVEVTCSDDAIAIVSGPQYGKFDVTGVKPGTTELTISCDGKSYTTTITVKEKAQTKVVYGDADGDGEVKLEDARLTLQAALGMVKLDESVTKRVDVDGKPGLTIDDAQMILEAALNIINLNM